jgi:cytochrome P450
LRNGPSDKRIDVFALLKDHLRRPVPGVSAGYVTKRRSIAIQKPVVGAVPVRRCRRSFAGLADVLVQIGSAPENPDDDGRKYSVISMDPPRHDRIRGVLKGFFTPKAVAAMEDALQSVVTHHLDRLRPGTTVDAMEAFAFSVPTDVIGDLLGVPKADREQLRVWWEAFLTRHEGEVAMPPSAIEANRKISAYIGDLIEERRSNPGEDLISIVLRSYL